MELALHEADDQYLFPRYIKDGACRATHASNALGKWLKKDFGWQHTALDTRSGIASEPLDSI